MIKILSMVALVVGSFLSTLSFAQTLEGSTDTSDEKLMAPLLDLFNGGQAVGAAQGSGATAGVLINGTLLPKVGDGYQRSNRDTDAWGTGMMVSFIQNVSPLIAAQYPGSVVRVGGMAQEHGGAYGPHKSHQNGLDADILFIGQKNYESVLDKDGNVTDRFNLEKNWLFWKAAVAQQIIYRGQPATAVSMILVDPRLKAHICAWATANVASLDALDVEVLRRLRPTVGHDDHFHLRFRCSPHYADCLNGGDGSGGVTGCEQP